MMPQPRKHCEQVWDSNAKFTFSLTATSHSDVVLGGQRAIGSPINFKPGRKRCRKIFPEKHQQEGIVAIKFREHDWIEQLEQRKVVLSAF